MTKGLWDIYVKYPLINSIVLIWKYAIFNFGLEISPIPPKRGLIIGKVWTLLYDLSFQDDLSILILIFLLS